MSQSLELRTLGQIELRGPSAGDPSAVLARPRDLAILVFLAVASPVGFHRRDTLLPLFWAESDQAHARGALSQTLYRLRRDLGEGVIHGRGQEEVGIPERALRVDVRLFEQLLDRGDQVEALHLYRGTLLEGFHVSGSRGFEGWLDARRAQLQRRAVTGAVQLADAAEQDGNPAGAARWLRRALEISPLDEELLCRLLRALSRAGDRPGAVETYEQFERDLRRDYDLEPDEETRALVSWIRRGRERPPSTSSPPASEVRSREPGRGSPTSIRSLAVLPFRTRSENSGSTMLAGGITDALVSALGRVGGLRVVSTQAGQELGVDAVIGGSVSRSGGRVRIGVRLTRMHPEEQLWAKTYIRNARDLAGVHGEIAHEIARAVDVRLTEDERTRLSKSRSVNPDAYEAYLKGRHFALIPGAVGRALDYFRTAVRHDPAYAPPYAGLAITYGNLALYAFVDPLESGPRARRAVERALALDPDSSEAHAARGLVLALFDHDWEEAEREIRRAVRLNPSNSLTWSYLGAFLASMGSVSEASRAAGEAVALDPAGPWSNFIRAWTTYRIRDFEAARNMFLETLDLHPGLAVCHGFLASTLLLLGRPEEAINEVKTGLAKTPSDQLMLGYGANVVGRAGNQGRARELLETLESLRSDRYVDSFYLAAARLGIGDREGALNILEKGVGRSVAAMFLKTDPLFDPLRSHERFRGLMEDRDFPRLEKRDGLKEPVERPPDDC